MGRARFSVRIAPVPGLVQRLVHGLVLGPVVGLGMLLGGCFIEPATPSTFRFQCSSDGECDPGFSCASGLCQQSCGGDAEEACPGDAPVCLNGYCSSICPLADDPCPTPQTCLSLAAPGEDPGESGVCTVECDDDNPCPDSQLCYAELGLCVATCMDTADCSSGEECLAGFCVPSSSGGGSFP